MWRRFLIIFLLQPLLTLSFPDSPALSEQETAGDLPESSAETRLKEDPSENDDFDYTGMVRIPSGKFKMGSTFSQLTRNLNACLKVDKRCKHWWFKDELPFHTVYLDTFWIDIFEVTNEKYLEFVLATGHRPALDATCETEECKKGNLWKENSFSDSIKKQPVTQVNWYDADAYCRWRGKRLPTEAEWEKAARGPGGNIYPWGAGSPAGRATYERKWRGAFTMTDVGSYSSGASVYYVFDMAGNVWEWVSDWYDREYYKTSPKKNPKGPKTGDFKVVRGGSWINHEGSLRSAFRRWSRPEVLFNDTGFRCAKDAIDETQKD